MSKYISLENLERYDSKMQERTASFCASKQDGMWRQTEKAGSVQFWPVGNSPLEGVVEFKFSETGPASGTKGPDNPSTISGVSSIGLTVCQEEGVDEHSYSLSLGGTYYGGTVDLATGLMTVTWAGESVDIFNSVNSVYDDTVLFIYQSTYYHLGNTPNISRHLTCDKFVTGYNVYASECCRFTGPTSSNNKGVGFLISKTRLNVSGAVDPSAPTNAEWLAAANAWLANNPIFVCYRLFTPTTIQLTPTQILALPQPNKYVPRLNTVYTDADSVQIVYQKNPVRDKFEKVQAIIAQGGNV